jgi:GT2 family glycosyltransferase
MPGAALSHHACASQRRLDLIGRSLACLGEGRLHEAYILTDMSCSTRVPAAQDLLLRAEIAARLGLETLEQADIEAAFAIDPSLPSVQLRMLAMLRQRGEAEAADALARVILRLDPQPAVLATAVAALTPAAGSVGIAWSQVSMAALRIDVFSAVPSSFALELHFERDYESVEVRSASDHALAFVLGAAGHVEIAWPEGARTVRLTSEPALDWVGPPAFRPHYRRLPIQRPQPAWRRGSVGPVTLIMPVYADIERTRACIDSVLASRSILPQRLVLVDDCGPDPRMRALLADYAQQPGVALIANAVNLGFIGSVNRALLDYPDGDVVLLNADTIVAPGWLERLSAAAYSRVGIGTATPLSNNGELTSVPTPFEATQMPAAGDVAEIDATLSALEPGRTVDIPNGIGFCLYITEACRRATGILNDLDYREGYLEEVDYCLRASERGFSHVCACDVFVGHAGSSSFQARKRSLVTHNLVTLERAFPNVKAITKRFMQVDPLCSLRLRLQKRLLETDAIQREPVMLVIGREAIPRPGTSDLPAVAALSSEGNLLRLSFAGPGGGEKAMLHRDGAMAPCRLPVELGSDDPLAALLGLIGSQTITRIIYLDGHHPDWARELPGRLAVDYDIHAVDDSVLGETISGSAGQAEFLARSGFLERARRFVSASSKLSDLALHQGLRRPEHEPLRLAPPIAIERRKVFGGPEGIAIFLNESDGKAWRRVQEMGRAIMWHCCALRLVVFGQTLDDDGLRRTGAVTVTAIPSEALAPAMFGLHRCVATIALIPDDVLEHVDLGVIAQGPRPLLSWNRYLPDVLGYGDGESRGFAADASAETVLRTLRDMLRDYHG